MSIFNELKRCPKCGMYQDKKMGKCINCDYIFNDALVGTSEQLEKEWLAILLSSKIPLLFYYQPLFSVFV
jgi:hypothetical protein